MESSNSNSEEKELQHMQLVVRKLIPNPMDIIKELDGIKSENNSSENALSKSVNQTQMQMQEGKVDMGKALVVGLVDTESSGTKSDKQDTISRSGNIKMQ
ncbi:hypothetical protein Tco_1263146 [Tanacetum coccineum]